MKLSLVRSCFFVSLAVLVACSGSGGGGIEQPGSANAPGGATSDNGSPANDPAGGGSTGGGGASGGSTSGGGGGSGGTSGGGTTDGGTSGGGMMPMTGTIFTIVMENHDYKEVVGSSNAPYINTLIKQYGLATNYMDSGVHPSLPNYLTMISGAPQYGGGMDLLPTDAPFPVTKDNLGTQLEAAKISWRSYQESTGGPCDLSTAGTLYAPKHDPFLYFTDTVASPLCADKNVDYASNFPADLAGGTYRYMWITPNLTDDGHNPQSAPVTGLKDCDAWAAKEIPKIMMSNAYKNGGVIFLTWDEAEGRNGDSKDQIPMIVITENIKVAGFTSGNAYSHKSYLATVEDLLGLPRLATVTSEPSMTEFFK